MIFLFADMLIQAGGIETYLDALATHLEHERIPFRVAVSELERCALIDDFIARGFPVYRQCRVPGDRWSIRQRLLVLWLSFQLRPGDWVFCIRVPDAAVYPMLVRAAHRRGARLAVSWENPPASIPLLPGRSTAVSRAVAQTDVVISTHRATLDQFREVYGYVGPVHIVPYHNLPVFAIPVPVPPGPPWKIGYMGRLSIEQKNLDAILHAVVQLHREGHPVELHLHGGGGDETALRVLARKLQAGEPPVVHFHGPYDHRRDLPGIVASRHFFIYASRFEGLPLTLLELLQAGRYCVTSRVGGIPDIYEGHPEAGIMTDPNDLSTLPAALREALCLAEAGALDPARVRQRYDGVFDLANAHCAWLAALGLSEPMPLQ